MTIREMIAEKRAEVGMTQKELSEMTGIPQNRISEFESGQRSMTSENIDKIFSALEIKFDKGSEDIWAFGKECAIALKANGVVSIDGMPQEEVANLSGKPEILVLKKYGDEMYELLSAGKKIDDRNTYNYVSTLINFHLALLNNPNNPINKKED